MVLLSNVVVCCDLSLPSLGFGLLLMNECNIKQHAQPHLFSQPAP